MEPVALLASTGRRGRFSLICSAVAFSILAWSACPARGQQSSGTTRTTGSEIGQELRNLEKEILDRKPSPKKTEVKVEKPAEEPKQVPTQPRTEPPVQKDGFKIEKLEIKGDQALLEKAGLFVPLRGEIVGKILTEREIVHLAAKYQKKLVEQGYYLARVLVPPVDYAEKVVVYEVDAGRIGKRTFYKQTKERVSKEAGKEPKKKEPYRGRYFSEAQLRRRLANLKEGTFFDYDEFYRAVYGLNVHPDLTVNTDLRVRSEETPDMRRRHVDMDFFVEERLPLHAVLSVGNSGTKATGDWRPSLTLQHLNLTKHDDILSFNLGPLSTDLEDLKSVAASYYYPYFWKHGGGWTLYGGFSDLSSEDVVEGIDVEGQGWFLGLQNTYNLVNNDAHSVAVSAGLVYRRIRDQLILESDQPGEEPFETESREVTLVPLSMAMTYSSARPDRLGGRNFLTAQLIANVEGFLGAADEETIHGLRYNADPTYFIGKLQAARLQPLSLFNLGAQGSAKERAGGQWLLFAKADGQLASGPLVPAEQKSAGGADSVRGFPERIVLGDEGVTATLELRTPILTDAVRRSQWGGKRLAPGADTADRLQLVTFVDGGYVRIREPLGEQDDYTLASAGLGLRLSVTSSLQMKFDWGVPLTYDDVLEEGPDPVKSSGRYHFSAQLQF